METHEAYPLDWPVGQARTPADRRGPTGHYTVSIDKARAHLLNNLKLMKATRVVLSTNLPLRSDGRGFLADTKNRIRTLNEKPLDPGVAVYWSLKGKDHVMACDCWGDVRSNIRAIGLAIEALRALDRSGVSGVLDRALSGMKALPAGARLQRPWRDVLNWSTACFAAGYMHCDVLDAALIKQCYLEKARLCHPDRGGSHDDMVELNAALAEAEAELGAKV